MSKRSHKKHSHREGGIAIPKKWLPFIAILIVALISISGVFALTRARVPEAPKVTGAPAIDVVQAHFDLGDVHFNQLARVTYQIKNAGDQTLRIQQYPNVMVLEGC